MLRFSLDGWGYWSLKINDDIFLLFADPPERDVPSSDAPEVQNIVTEYGVDPTGETESTEAIQRAICLTLPLAEPGTTLPRLAANMIPA